ILPTQVEEVRAFLTARKAPDAGPPRLIPVMRARVVGIEGRQVNLQSFDDVRRQGSLTREYTITYRDHLEANEKVVDGTFWTNEAPLPEDAPIGEVSIEKQAIHERGKVDVGDIMRFDVLGRIVKARVTSIREVQWEDARSGGFMFVFRPGAFAHAPQTWIAIVKAPLDASERGRFQRDLVAKFPNISAIDVLEVLNTIQNAVRNI